MSGLNVPAILFCVALAVPSAPAVKAAICLPSHEAWKIRLISPPRSVRGKAFG